MKVKRIAIVTGATGGLGREFIRLLLKEKNIDFGELKKLNKDIVAWIKIPGTRINYPIVQGMRKSLGV